MKNKKTYEEDVRRALRKPITLPDEVEEHLGEAYAQIRQRCSELRETKRKHSKVGKWIVVAAACMALAGTSVAAMAAAGVFTKKVRQEQASLTYSFNLDYEMVPGTFEVTAHDLPEGFKEQEDGKYWPDNNWGHGITVMPVYSAAELDRIGNRITMEGVEKGKKTTLAGSEAHVITLEGAEENRLGSYIFLFQPQEGYVLEIYGDYNVSEEELESFADSLTVVRTGNDAFDTEQEKIEKAEEKKKEEQDFDLLQRQEEAIRLAGLKTEELIWPGEEGIARYSGEVGFTVKSAALSDTLPDVEHSGFYDWKGLKGWLCDDGTLRPYLRQHFDQKGNLLEERETKQKFLTVCIQAARYSMETWNLDGMTALDACLVNLEPKENGTYSWGSDTYQACASEDYDLQMERRCIYLDQPEFTKGDERDHSFFWRKLQEGQKLEYTLIFVVDEDQTEHLALNLNEFANMPGEKPVYFMLPALKD